MSVTSVLSDSLLLCVSLELDGESTETETVSDPSVHEFLRLGVQSNRRRGAALPWFFTATRFLVIIANRTLKHQKKLGDFGFDGHRWSSQDRIWRKISPWLFDRETVDSKHLPQCILGAVDNVLLLLVIQLLLDDVLTQVEHHLQGEPHWCIMGDIKRAADTQSTGAEHTSFMVKTSFVAPACWSKLWNSTFGLTWTHRREMVKQEIVKNSWERRGSWCHSPVCRHQRCLCWALCRLTSLR